jgi:hypothetical protein
MNLTLSVDKLVVKEARKVAAAMGTSVNQLVRDYLADLVGKGDADQDIAELEALSLIGGGRARGWSFDRDELHDRS